MKLLRCVKHTDRLQLLILLTCFRMMGSDCINEGFLPPNTMKIPVDSFLSNEMTEAKFNQIISKAEKIYSPIVAKKGGKLVFNRLWNDATVNASAERNGNNWIVNMYGGLARHPAITEDGFALIVCHELGHHLGGAPKFPGQWAADEGEADYFSTLKGLRNHFADEDNVAIVKNMKVEQVAVAACEKQFPEEKAKALCVRESMAGLSSANLSAALASSPAPDFGTPDPAQVAQTNDAHPLAQCRLDTYFGGSVCGVSVAVDLGETDPTVGSCSSEKGDKIGIRPRCWYKPGGGGGGGGGGIAKQPTVGGQTTVIAHNPDAPIPVDYDVSEFPTAGGAYLEFSAPNQEFSDPNSTLPDPHHSVGGAKRGVRGVFTVVPRRNLPGWGRYGFRIIPLDAAGNQAVGRFSNPSHLELSP